MVRIYIYIFPNQHWFQPQPIKMYTCCEKVSLVPKYIRCKVTSSIPISSSNSHISKGMAWANQPIQ